MPFSPSVIFILHLDYRQYGKWRWQVWTVPGTSIQYCNRKYGRTRNNTHDGRTKCPISSPILPTIRNGLSKFQGGERGRVSHNQGLERKPSCKYLFDDIRTNEKLSRLNKLIVYILYDDKYGHSFCSVTMMAMVSLPNLVQQSYLIS